MPMKIAKVHLTRWMDRHRIFERLPWLRRVRRAEALLLLSSIALIVAASVFLELSDDVQEGDTQRIDEYVVKSFRRADDPGVPIGPAWLREVGIDITALGSNVVTALAVAAVALFLLFQRRFAVMWLVLAASAGAFLLNYSAKTIIDRDRPEIVPHLREVSTPSFPSGHATLAAAVFMTLGVIVAQVVKGRTTKLYCLLFPMFMVFLVGLSRVYLGVHYPSDVVGGWLLGFVWATACWVIANYLQQRGLLAAGHESPGKSELET